MPRDNKPNQPEPECNPMDLLDKLFGPLDLSDEGRDILYGGLFPSGTNPSAIVHRLAEDIAAEYRAKNHPLPDDIQAVLHATREPSR